MARPDARLGAMIFDHPESMSGWAAHLNERAVRVDRFEGVLTEPDTIWWTNADLFALSRMGISQRFLPENYFWMHLRDILEMVGIPSTELSFGEAKDMGIPRAFCVPQDPERGAEIAALIAGRVAGLTVPLNSLRNHSLAIRDHEESLKNKKGRVVHPPVPMPLRRLVRDEEEPLTKTLKQRRTGVRGGGWFSFAVPPLEMARRMVSWQGLSGEVTPGPGPMVSYPDGAWEATRLVSGITLDAALADNRQIICRARVRLPTEISSFLLLGSGTKDGLREYFSTPELRLFQAMGADVELDRHAWVASGHIEPAAPSSDLWDLVSISSGLAALSRLRVMGIGNARDPGPAPGTLWLRGMDRAHSLFLGLEAQRVIGEIVGQRQARLQSYYLGTVALSVAERTDEDRVVIQSGLMKLGLLPKGKPIASESVLNPEFSGPEYIKFLAAARLAGPEMAMTLDQMCTLPERKRTVTKKAVIKLLKEHSAAKILIAVCGTVSDPTSAEAKTGS